MPSLCDIHDSLFSMSRTELLITIFDCISCESKRVIMPMGLLSIVDTIKNQLHMCSMKVPSKFPSLHVPSFSKDLQHPKPIQQLPASAAPREAKSKLSQVLDESTRARSKYIQLQGTEFADQLAQELKRHADAMEGLYKILKVEVNKTKPSDSVLIEVLKKIQNKQDWYAKAEVRLAKKTITCLRCQVSRFRNAWVLHVSHVPFFKHFMDIKGVANQSFPNFLKHWGTPLQASASGMLKGTAPRKVGKGKAKAKASPKSA